MTVWDKIFIKKKKGVTSWITPSDRYLPLLKQLINRSDFRIKYALDIGCGQGKCLKLLQSAGFITDGIDSSRTSVAMTKKLLEDDSNIICADMFEYEFPKNKYDLIISTLTIHHGTKTQIEKLIGRIYGAIVDGGISFITLPDFVSNKKWIAGNNHKEIGSGTFIPMDGVEKGLMHSYYTQQEISKLFTGFSSISLEIDNDNNWIIKAKK